MILIMIPAQVLILILILILFLSLIPCTDLDSILYNLKLIQIFVQYCTVPCVLILVFNYGAGIFLALSDADDEFYIFTVSPSLDPQVTAPSFPLPPTPTAGLNI